MRNRQHIAVGVITDTAAERILIARRPDHVHLGGLWEFPGGKLLPGESVSKALRRELQEELNISVKKTRPLIRVNHDYPEQRVRLDVWMVSSWSGSPAGMQGQELRWVAREELAGMAFPDADRPIITAINLPYVYGITPELESYGPEFYSRLEELLTAGLRLLQLRCKLLDLRARMELLYEVAAMCGRNGCRILLNGMPDRGLMKYMHGVHLPARDLVRQEKRPLGDGYLLAASCHNAHELAHAERIGADFAVLSPVRKTVSHPGAKPLGWTGFNRLTDAVSIPVYALGGMQMTDIARAQDHGGQGVAMIRGLWFGTESVSGF
jgi:8-oxo-dGTP diphosphatase